MRKYAEVNLIELTFDPDGRPRLDPVGASLIEVSDELVCWAQCAKDNVCFTMTSKEWEAHDPRTPLYDNVFAWGFADPCSSLEEVE